jgi:hypothetical protein
VLIVYLCGIAHQRLSLTAQNAADAPPPALQSSIKSPIPILGALRHGGAHLLIVRTVPA